VGIYIKSGGNVEVRAPYFVAEKAITAFVNSKSAWIEAKIQEVQEREQTKAQFSLQEGQSICLSGREYCICFAPVAQIQIIEQNIVIPIHMQDNASVHMIDFLKRQIRDILLNRVGMYSQKMGVKFTALKVNGARTRWGSCSRKGSLNFSWRLIFASLEEIDYVVVHELAHILQQNHSKKFWSIVENTLPNYKANRKGLKLLAKNVSFQSWEQ